MILKSLLNMNEFPLLYIDTIVNFEDTMSGIIPNESKN